MESVTEAWTLYDAAQDAAAVGGEQALAAQKAYLASLEGMTPATRDSAAAFIGLKTEYAAWSDEMSASTMPVFTQGIEILRDLLPVLTPFVQSAAGAIGQFLAKVSVGVKSAGFKEWADGMAAASGPALTDFLATVKNLGVGFAGLLSAFLPVSDGMTGGLADMSAGFAAWGTGLKDSAGFAKFLDTASTGADTLALVGSAAVNLLSALSPLLGTTAMLANGLARIVNATPTPVLTALAVVLLTVKAGMLAYSVYTGIATVATNVQTSATYRAIAGWTRMMAVGLMVYVRIAGAAVVSAATTSAAWVGSALVSIGTWIAAVVRAGITAAIQFTMMAARAVAWAVVMAAQWLIAMGPIGWVIAIVIGLVVLIVANWDRIKSVTAAVWDWIWGKIKAIASAILNFIVKWNIASIFLRHWDRIKSGAVAIVTGLVNFMAKLPGRINGAVSGLGNLLYSKGQAVVQGLWNGIQAMGGWIRSKLIGFAKSAIPGPIAKALGIASPSKVTTAQGRWIAQGLVVGMTGSTKQVKAASTKLADIVRSSLAPGKARSTALGKISAGSKKLIGLATQEVKLAARIKTATKALGDQIKARDKLAADVRKGVLDSANITASATGGAVSAQSILATLTAKMQQAKQFAAQLAKLRTKGIRSDLIAQIAQAGAEQGSGAAAALATASAGQISQINATQAQLVGAATAAGSTAGTAMYGAGIQAAQGLVKGLKSQQKAIEKQMATIATAMTKAIKKSLKIKSPSQLMADQVGAMVPAGIMVGMADGQAPLDKAMADSVKPPPPSGAGGPMVARPAAPLLTAGGAQVVRIEFVGPEEGKRWIRGIVRKDGRGSVQRAFGYGKEQTA